MCCDLSGVLCAMLIFKESNLVWIKFKNILMFSCNLYIFIFQTSDGLACAMLAVYLDCASNLPVSILVQ